MPTMASLPLNTLQPYGSQALLILTDQLPMNFSNVYTGIFPIIPYGTKLGGRKLWRIGANKHFGGQNIDELAVWHSKIARVKRF